jgi:quercetin dioxygenase-like cupin family protein
MATLTTKEIQVADGQAGIFDANDFTDSSGDEATVVRVYRNPDCSIVVWNLEPGQPHAPHSHPENTQVFVVLSGEGEYTAEQGAPTKRVRAGDWIIVPRGAVHGIRNTGSTKLSYVAFTTYSTNGYVSIPYRA